MFWGAIRSAYVNHYSSILLWVQGELFISLHKDLPFLIRHPPHMKIWKEFKKSLSAYYLTPPLKSEPPVILKINGKKVLSSFLIHSWPKTFLRCLFVFAESVVTSNSSSLCFKWMIYIFFPIKVLRCNYQAKGIPFFP